MRLRLTIRPNQFARQLADEIAAGGLTVVDLVERLIAERLEDSIGAALGGRLVKAPRATVHPAYYKNRFENLAHLARHGYSTWYPELKLASNKTDLIDISGIDPEGFDLETISYGGGIRLDYRHTVKELKTQTNHTIRLNRLSIPATTFAGAIATLKHHDMGQPRIANLAVGYLNFVDDRIPGFRAVSFDHVISGERVFCGCHREAHEAMLADAATKAPSFVANSWPHRAISLLTTAEYAEDICHFCVGRRHGEDAIHDWYGPQIKHHYGAYVDVLVHRDGMDVRTAKAEAKRRLSISRWVREDELCGLINRIFPGCTIRREASPPWLGLQRLDIYLPELKLAIEHQGEQHYRPIEAFGGTAAFTRTQERDQRKRELCKQHGVTVVDVRYDAPLTIPSLRARLRRWLK